MAKKNLGRQKVAMVKMTNESHLLVTFSKRRGGLFKKASEISVLCGAEVVIIVFSPGKKVYSFGHPSVDIVTDRYLGIEKPDTSGTWQIVEAHRNAHIHELGMHLNQRTSLLDDEKKRGEELNQVIKANQQRNWWQKPIEELDESQLLQLRAAMVQLKKKVEAEKLAVPNENPRQFYLGSSSTGWMIPGFDENMVVAEYTVPSMIVPPPGPGYNLNPAQEGYNIVPEQGYTVNPAQEGYNIVPEQGYTVNPAQEGYNIVPEQGYTVNPAQEGYNIVPEQGYTVNPAQEGYNIVPEQGYTVNPAEEYIVDPAEEYIVDPIEEYIVDPAVNPADGDNAKPEGNDTPGFVGGYIIDPQENDILDTSGLGGYNSNPGGNDNLDSLEKVLKDFEGGFF
ncbi:hypothetical protein HRI_000729500 [Hibiscus trionum]|uniref:MADS-box domain-containing protein n=1 Tax=Hibiscus trionum TaxID=183268 RepID=A0A9W7H4P6_HIBTR|nr:hypothetical protein HRI_000729500 [Hibiscus trionum]